jgi:hypothetical protein
MELSDMNIDEFLTSPDFKKNMETMTYYLFFYEQLKKEIEQQIDAINPYRGSASLTGFEITGDGIIISAQSEDHFRGEYEYNTIIDNFKVSFEDIQNHKAGENIKAHLDEIKAKELAKKEEADRKLREQNAAQKLINDRALYEKLKAQFEPKANG